MLNLSANYPVDWNFVISKFLAKAKQSLKVRKVCLQLNLHRQKAISVYSTKLPKITGKAAYFQVGCTF